MKKKIYLPLLFIFVLVFTLLSIYSLPSDKLYGDTLNVGPGQTIQAAIDAANSGDTIIVAAGTYYENLVINKDITLIGAGSSSSVIDGSGIERCVEIGTVNVYITGFKITGGSTSIYGGGIYNRGTLTISNSTISDNTVSSWGGGIFSTDTLNISNSIISGNTAAYGGGIFSDRSTLTISKSTISGNTAIDGGGISSSLSTLTITNSTISGNTATNEYSGIKNYPTSMANAKNNWWGSSTGPAHSSNPEGTGDSISDMIDYDPWLTSDPFYVAPTREEIIKPVEQPVEQESIWIRNVDMTCYQVWINEEGNFEFIFWWEYANNNWVQIYDMKGNLVFEIDMEHGNARFEAPLPDGMYNIKTFHEAGKILQEFVIGKP